MSHLGQDHHSQMLDLLQNICIINIFFLQLSLQCDHPLSMSIRFTFLKNFIRSSGLTLTSSHIFGHPRKCPFCLKSSSELSGTNRGNRGLVCSRQFNSSQTSPIWFKSRLCAGQLIYSTGTMAGKDPHVGLMNWHPHTLGYMVYLFRNNLVLNFPIWSEPFLCKSSKCPGKNHRFVSPLSMFKKVIGLFRKGEHFLLFFCTSLVCSACSCTLHSLTVY